MPISPYLVTLPGQEPVQFRNDVVAMVMTQIDGLLADPRSAYTCYEDLSHLPRSNNLRAFRVKFEFALSEAEKMFLIKQYMTAGWSQVEIFADIDMSVSSHQVTVIRLYLP